MGLIDDQRAAQAARAATRPNIQITDLGNVASPAGLIGTGAAAGVGGGFRPASSIKVRRRLVVSIEALEGCGKTNFALTSTAVGNVAVHNFDVGLEGVVNKFDTSKIMVAPYRMPQIVGLTPQEASNIAHGIWTQFTQDYDSVLMNPDIRTIVWDTATENWDLLRIARLGKLSQVMPHHYAPVNQEYREQLRKAYDTDKNLILIHKLGAEWENKVIDGKEKGTKTGRYERKGFSDIGFAVQVEVRAWKEQPAVIGAGPVYRMAVTKCRQNPMAEGQVLEGITATFPYLGMLVYPDSEPSDWGL